MIADAFPSERAYLTKDGRRLLEERVQLLTSTVEELQAALEDPERRADSVEGYHRAAQELARLGSLLDKSGTVEDVPDDPQVVELGDTVTILLDDGTEETYIVVHPVEAATEHRRISVDSPLGQALLGQRVGETIEVPVPRGSYRCTVLSALRHTSALAGRADRAVEGV